MNIERHKFLVLFSYIGTKYSGIQRQTTRILKEGNKPSDKTVQYYIEQSLESVNPKPAQDVKLTASSRTDRGVHAFENSALLQMVHPNPLDSYCPSHLIEMANEYLKAHSHEIKLNKIHLVSPAFHFRKHIKWRSYYYRLAVVKPEVATHASFQPESYLPINELNRCSLLRVPLHLDIDKMSQAVDYFLGTHNFTNFSAFSRNLVYYDEDYFTRKIDSISINPIDCESLEAMNPAYRNINLYEFNITSRAFLYRQIRRMVGSIIMVGSSQFSLDRFKRLLDNPDKDKWSSSFITAPPEGLYLSRVKYDPKDFLNPSELESSSKPEKSIQTRNATSDSSESSNDDLDDYDEEINDQQYDYIDDTNDDDQNDRDSFDRFTRF